MPCSWIPCHFCQTFWHSRHALHFCQRASCKRYLSILLCLLWIPLAHPTALSAYLDIAEVHCHPFHFSVMIARQGDPQSLELYLLQLCLSHHRRQSLWVCPFPTSFIAMTGVWSMMGKSIPNGLFNCKMLKTSAYCFNDDFFFLNICSFLEFIQTHVVRELSSIKMAGMIISVLQFFNFEFFWPIGWVCC